MLTMILSVALITQQTPEGGWKLKSVTVDSKPVKDPSGMLKDFGGLAIGTEWLFDELEDGAGGATLDGLDCGYYWKPKLSTLVVDRETTTLDVKQSFRAKITGKTMKLSYKQGKQPVELTFTKEE